MLSLLVTLALAADSRPVTPVPAVDLDRYLGRWYEIARYPNRFQKGCAGEVTADYTRAGSGLRVVNRCRRPDGSVNEAEGAARVMTGSGNARLKVRFAPAWLGVLPFVWGDYWIIGLAEDYRWAVVGTPDRNYLWILSRSATLSDDDWNAALAKVKEKAFDPARLIRTRQQ